MELSNGRGHVARESVKEKDVKPEDGNYNIYQNAGTAPTYVTKP
jgi:hypothetical protein